MRVKLRELADAASHDPAAALWKAAGDLTDYNVNTDLLLIATYIAPPHTVKGPNGEDIIIHRTDNSMQEDRYQGKVALVLKPGPYSEKFAYALKPKAGEWVVFRNSDGMEIFIRDRRASNDGLSVRILDARFVFMTVSDPSLIY